MTLIDNIDFHGLEAQKYWAPPSSWTKEKIRETTESRIFSGDWTGARKMDGAFYKFVKDENGEMELLGRSKGVGGDYLNKINWVPHLHPFFDSLPKGTCLLGEIYFPNNEGSKNVTTIMGCLENKALARQENGPKLWYYIFDILALDGKSLLGYTMEERVETLKALEEDYKMGTEFPYTRFAHYSDGKELWERLNLILMNGGEGIVLTRKGARYQPGKRPSKDCQKVKKEVQQTIDCFFTGRTLPPTHIYTGKEIENWIYWENSLTNAKYNENMYVEYDRGAPLVPVTKGWYYGWAGSLEIGVIADSNESRSGAVYVNNTHIVPIGYLSGLTEEIKSNPSNYAFKPIEVTCMEIDNETHGLRHAKLVQFRPDLAPSDCTYSKIFG